MWVVFLFTAMMWVFFYSLLILMGGRKIRMQKRLNQLVEAVDTYELDQVRPQSFGERVILPFTESIYRFISGFSSDNLRSRIERSLRSVGKTGHHAVEQWIALRIFPGFLLPAVLGLMMARFGLPVGRAILFSAMMIICIQFGMNYYLIRKIRIRKDNIEKQLPDVLDIITVSVEAGLSFDGAVERVVQKSANELSRELATTLKEMRMGKLRQQALKGLAERCDVPDLTSWVAAMIQADELGVGISNVLRVQSAKMREKRRFRAREKSMKAPIKILFPLIFFIFPSIFIVLLGPAVIHVIEVFAK